MILDGKATAAAIRAALRENIAKDREKAGRAPCLAVVLVGEDPASQVYVRNKEKACADAGIDTASYRKPASIPQKELEAFIASLNADPAVDGILLQLPLPEGLDARPCIDAISPEKDVDGLTAVNQGRVAMNVPGLRPCTPAGILAILDRYGISVSGKRAVVIGRSNLVGRPIALNGDKYRIMRQRNWRCDTAPARAELGYSPQYGLARGVRETVRWYKDNGWI